MKFNFAGRIIRNYEFIEIAKKYSKSFLEWKIIKISRMYFENIHIFIFFNQ